MSEFVTEVPSSLKQLARLVVRGFYLIEDSLIIDMLVRNPCMKEDDICDLLKFERKMLRGRIDTLKNDKFIQTKMKMETGPDGKAQRQNYYYINYKVFVNVVKYKLDHMRRKMETEERNATSRASFKCPSCDKTYTDLQADQLFDPVSGEFLCTFCGAAVEEDAAALPRQDSRMMLARFNEVMEPLFVLLKEVEGIKLAPELLEPEPLDIQDILHRDDRKRGRRDGVGVWSGEATRTSQQTETTVTVLNSDEESAANQAVQRKERPVWMVESTVVTDAAPSSSAASSAALLLPSVDGGSSGGAGPSPLLSGGVSSQADDSQMSRDDIMSVLLQHEKRAGESRRAPAAALKNGAAADSSSDDSDGQLARRGNRRARPDSPVSPQRQAASSLLAQHTVGSPSADADVEMMDSDEDESVPTVQVGSERVPISDVTGDVIARMTSDEKEAYIVTYQECYGDMHE